MEKKDFLIVLFAALLFSNFLVYSQNLNSIKLHEIESGNDSAAWIMWNPPNLNLFSPNGGEYWTTGSFPRIAWTSSGVPIIKIELSTDEGNT